MKKARAEMLVGMIWILIALIVVGSIGAVTFSSTSEWGVGFDLSKFTYENIAMNAKVQVNFYLMLGTLSAVFFMKEKEVMAWLEKNAPF